MPQSNTTGESSKVKPPHITPVPVPVPIPVIPSSSLNPNPNLDPRLGPTWAPNLVFVSPYPPFAPQAPLQSHSNEKDMSSTKPEAAYLIAEVGDPNLLPKLDMLFDSENDAYEFYNTYAEKLGFFIRRSTLWTTAKNIITRRTFVCSREGFREKKKGAKEAKTPRPETRIGCPACLTIRLTSNGKYKVTDFVPSHNHVLCTGFQSLTNKKLRKKVKAIRANLADETVKTPDFRSEDEAYEFYSMYASKIGFCVRRASMTVGNDGVITRRMFVCSKEGFRERKKGAKRVKNPRPETRTGCPACMVVRLGENGLYHVAEFVTCHNHQLMISSNSDLVLENNDVEIDKIEEENEILKSSRGKRVKSARVGDIGGILEYLQRMQGDNPSFFYGLKSDENDKVTNFFWADSRSMLDFMHFGDVVCFDTSYRVNGFDRPLVLFTGLNHHKQNVIFGTGLMYDESLNSFKWLFDTFKKAMNGKVPKTVLTDRYEEIVEAVGSSWIGTVHKYCVWQIYQNALEQLSQAFHGSRTLGFDFSKCLFDCEDEDDFLSNWNEMLEKYDLKDNKWLQNLFEEREKWSLAYGRDSFYGDLKSVQQKENLYLELKKILSSENDILGFFGQFEKLMEERRILEAQTDLSSNQSSKKPPSMRILRQASNSYTPSAFKMFEREFELYMDCTVYNSREIGTISEYKVSLEENNSKDHFVKFDSLDGSVNCTCKKFEFLGIPCRHILKVLDTRNIKELPQELILKRWRRDAKMGNLRGKFENFHEGDLQNLQEKRLNYLCRVFGIVMNKAAKNLDSIAYLEGQSRVILDQSEPILQERPSDLSSLSVENIVSGGGLQGHMHFMNGTNDGAGPLTFPFTLNAGTLEYR